MDSNPDSNGLENIAELPEESTSHRADTEANHSPSADRLHGSPSGNNDLDLPDTTKDDTPPSDSGGGGLSAIEEQPESADLSPADQGVLDGQTSRPMTSGRIPSSGLRRAALSRSTYVSGDYSSDEDSSDLSDDNTHNVLITEVQETFDDSINTRTKPGILDADKETLSSKKSLLSSVTSQFYEDAEDDGYWDTDLDIEEEREEHDPTGRTQYARACERLGVVPVSYFSRHITDNDICMRYHGLGPLGTKAIAKVLRTNITVERLNLTGNWMEGEGGMYMARMLLENDYITDLTISENKLCAEGAHHLSKMLLVNAGLRHLDLSANDFSDECAGCLAEAMDQNKFLKSLVLSRNHFEEDGGEILGPAISSNDVLDHLDLSWNLFRRRGAVAVARGIKENVRLKSVNLSWNGFGDKGGAAIADAIAVNESLQELDISGNRFEYDVAVLIGKALKRNEELRILRMGNNPITTAGCIALATALNDSEISVLQMLDLREIPVEYEFLKLVAEIQKKRPGFEVVHGPVLMSGNTAKDIGKAPVDPYKKKDPLLILREHIVVNDTRIFDILKRYDENQTHSVPPDKFAAALEELGVPFSKDQLASIAKKMDKNSDGKIYYGDMLNQADNKKSDQLYPGMSRDQQTTANGKDTVAKLQLTKVA